MTEMRQAFRRLRRHRAASCASVLALGGSIAAAVVTWALLTAVVLRPIPVRDADYLFVLGTEGGKSSRTDSTFSTGFIYPWYLQITETGVFDSVTAEWGDPLVLPVKWQHSERQARVAFVRHNYFGVLAATIPLGRSFAEEDDRRGAPIVAVVSNAYWRAALNASPTVLGERLHINGQPLTIIGVAPRGFRGSNLARIPDVFVPLEALAELGDPLTNYFADPRHRNSPVAGLKMIGRVTHPIQATARLAAIRAPGDVTVPDRLRLLPVNVEALPRSARSDMRRFAQLLAATVGFIVLVGCITVGVLLLTRTEAREAELGLCLALGASPLRLVGGIFAEGFTLTIAGAVLSLPIAALMFDAIRAFQLPGRVGISSLDLSVDQSSVWLATGASVLTAGLITITAGGIGFYRTWRRIFRTSLVNGFSTRRPSISTPLLVAQLGMTFVLLNGGILFIRSVSNALDVNASVKADDILSVRMLFSRDYDQHRLATFVSGLRSGLENVPGFLDLGLRQAIVSSSALRVDGVSQTFGSPVEIVAVDGGYFGALGITTSLGRDFARSDRQGAPRVAVASRSLARMLGSDGAVGRRIQLPMGDSSNSVEVVGIVPDVIRNVSVLQPAILYVPRAQQPIGSLVLDLVIGSGNLPETRDRLLSAVGNSDSSIKILAMTSLRDELMQQMSPQRFGAAVLNCLGGLALLLTTLAGYVMAEVTATRRMREMAVRAALGASTVDLQKIIFGNAIAVLLLGISIGVMTLWIAASTIRSLLFQVAALDVATIVFVSVVIMTVVLGVSVKPVLKVRRVDLAKLLRDN